MFSMQHFHQHAFHSGIPAEIESKYLFFFFFDGLIQQSLLLFFFLLPL